MGLGLCYPLCYAPFLWTFLCYWFPLFLFLIWTHGYFWVRHFHTHYTWASMGLSHSRAATLPPSVDTHYACSTATCTITKPSTIPTTGSWFHHPLSHRPLPVHPHHASTCVHVHYSYSHPSYPPCPPLFIFSPFISIKPISLTSSPPFIPHSFVFYPPTCMQFMRMIP